MSSHNIYKFNQIVLQDSETRVIDSNERMAERIAELSKNLRETMEETDGEVFAQDFTDGIEAIKVSQLLSEDGSNIIKDPANEGPGPQELLDEAREQADAMLEQAKEEAEALKSRAYEEACAKGREKGYADGYQEAEALRAKLQREYQEKEEQLTRFYYSKLEELEPTLVDALTDIYEHVFRVNFSDSRDVVIHLLKSTLQKMEGCSEYLIHVSGDDLPFVSMQKNTLLEAGGIVNAHFDVIEDVTLKKNQCLIETENGIFDCSLGVELKELKKQLLLLSYEGKDTSNEN